MVNIFLDVSNCPANLWLLCLLWVCFIINYTASARINHQLPITYSTGQTADISMFLRCYWWESVYYKVDDTSFPSDSPEESGRFVGIAENVGHFMTFKVLSDSTKQVLYRSNVRTAEDATVPNRRLDELLNNDSIPVNEFIQGRNLIPVHLGENVHSAPTTASQPPPMPVFNAEDLIGRTFLLPSDPGTGKKHRARIVKAIEDYDQSLAKYPD